MQLSLPPFVLRSMLQLLQHFTEEEDEEDGEDAEVDDDTDTNDDDDLDTDMIDDRDSPDEVRPMGHHVFASYSVLVFVHLWHSKTDTNILFLQTEMDGTDQQTDSASWSFVAS